MHVVNKMGVALAFGHVCVNGKEKIKDLEFQVETCQMQVGVVEGGWDYFAEH